MRRFYACLIAVLPVLCFAQNTVRLLCDDGNLIKVYRNDRPLNKTPQAGVSLENIKDDTLYLKIEFEGSSARHGVTLYLLRKGRPVDSTEFNYRVRLHKKNLLLQYMGAYPQQDLPATIVPEKKQPADSSRAGQYGRYCELQNGEPVYYNNLPAAGTCSRAMPDEFLGYAAQLIKKLNSHRATYGIIENTLNNNCVSTEQLNTLLGNLEDDLERLKLIELGYYHVIDPQNHKALVRPLRLDASHRELERFLAHAGDQNSRLAASCASPSPEEEIRKLSDNLAALMSDGQRANYIESVYSNYCFSIRQVLSLLQKFVHDREKLQVARLLYFKCSEKAGYSEVSKAFSYPQYIKEFQDFLEKQGK